MSLIRPLFAAALPDEIALRERVRPAVLALRGTVPDREALRAITARDGIEAATVLLHEALLASPHGEFVRAVDARIPGSVPAGVRLLVIPTLFYREHPEIGGDGALVLSVARRWGLPADRVEIASLGAVEENARILLDHLRGVTEPAVWVVTLSKGALELKRALQLADPGILGRVQGWINISGMLGGSPVVDRFARTPLHRLVVETWFRLRGGRGAALLDMAQASPFTRSPLHVPSHVDVVNVLGLPLSAHLTPTAIATHRRLAPLGPNDGFVAFWDAVAPGVIYPVWGVDHYLRTPRLESLLGRLLGAALDRRAAEAGASVA